MTKSILLRNLINTCYFCEKLHLPTELTKVTLNIVYWLSSKKYTKEASYKRGYPFHATITQEASDYLWNEIIL